MRDGAHGRDELDIGSALHQVSRRAGLEQRQQIFLLGVHREHEDAGRRVRRQNRLRRRGAIHPGHGQVHDHDVRMQALRERDGFRAVRRLANHRDVAGRTQHRLQSCANDGMIVGQHDANHITGHGRFPVWNHAPPTDRWRCGGRRERNFNVHRRALFAGLEMISNVPSSSATRSRMVKSPVAGTASLGHVDVEAGHRRHQPAC